MINAILLKPLDGDAEGSTREFTNADFEALEAVGAVKRAPEEEAASAPAPPPIPDAPADEPPAAREAPRRPRRSAN